ncbi:MAG: hypothetical protein EA357_02830 [Micavibrio sp.]|nr:MAG: hypothetical protein EA357_02830 [Micavibrio sp.]
MAIKTIAKTEFQTEVLGSEKTVLVGFYLPDEKTCDYMQSVLDDFNTAREDKIKTVKIDAAKDGALAAEHGITHVPAILVFKGGKRLDGFEGACTAAELESWVDFVLLKNRENPFSAGAKELQNIFGGAVRGLKNGLTELQNPETPKKLKSYAKDVFESGKLAGKTSAEAAKQKLKKFLGGDKKR